MYFVYYKSFSWKFRRKIQGKSKTEYRGYHSLSLWFDPLKNIDRPWTCFRRRRLNAVLRGTPVRACFRRAAKWEFVCESCLGMQRIFRKPNAMSSGTCTRLFFVYIGDPYRSRGYVSAILTGKVLGVVFCDRAVDGFDGRTVSRGRKRSVRCWVPDRRFAHEHREFSSAGGLQSIFRLPRRMIGVRFNNSENCYLWTVRRRFRSKKKKKIFLKSN